MVTRRLFFASLVLPFVVPSLVPGNSIEEEERRIGEVFLGRIARPPIPPHYPRIWDAIAYLKDIGEEVDLLSVRVLVPDQEAVLVRCMDHVGLD